MHDAARDRLMRVAYRGNFRPTHSTETHVAASLELLGHEVVRLQEDEVSWDGTFDACGRCDVLLWTQTYPYAKRWSNDDALKTLDRLRSANTPTVGYHLDRWWGLDREVQLHEEAFFRVDLLLTADGGHDAEWRSIGVNHRWLPPGVFGPECARGRKQLAYASKLAFLGSHPYPHKEWEPQRSAVVSSLQARYGRNFRLWPRGRAVRGEKLQVLFASADVVVGDSCLAGGATRYWSDRIPETLGRGGFLIHPAVEGLSDWYVDGEHLVTYTLGDLDELHHKIDYWLARPVERQAVSERGMQLVRARDTYQHRMAEVMEQVELMLSRSAAFDGRLIRASAAITVADLECDRCAALVPNNCASCGQGSVEIVLCRGEVPLANTLQAVDAPALKLYSLHFGICAMCSAAQVMDRVAPDVIFNVAYPYRSSVSDAMVDRCHALVDAMCIERALGPEDVVVEIGSNDGYLLQHYLRHGVQVIGVDPAPGAASDAEARGVRTLVAHFDSEYGRWLSSQRVSASVVHANNVLAHVPDVTSVLRGIATILRPSDGVLVVETPYLVDLIDGFAFDTIYHEHVYAWTVTAFVRACRRAGLQVQRVERLSVHGGSIRFFVGHSSSSAVDSSVTGLLRMEHERKVDSFDGLRRLSDIVDATTRSVRTALLDDVTAGRRIAAYGAAAKGVMLLSAIGLSATEIEYVVDSTESKQGMLLPGSMIPIMSPSHAHEHPPDVMLVLAWNWADEIIAREVELLDRGVEFFVPLPHVKRVSRKLQTLVLP